MTLRFVRFDDTQARAYRKATLVQAFRTDDAITFHKPWGEQHVPAGSWVMVPLVEDRPAGDIYGCHPESFVETYKATDRPNIFRKEAAVRAYQPGEPFAVRTTVADEIETETATGGATDWLVRNPGGEIYVVSEIVFDATYELSY